MENPLNCIICNKILKDPVNLPCGHTICKSHEIERRERNETSVEIYCQVCDLSHSIPDLGFPSNRPISILLKRKQERSRHGNQPDRC